MKTFDILVIGAGPGGYVAAIKAAQLGFSTALVEKEEHLGGTCLNVGCIPSKALLHSTEQYHFLQHDADKHGIKVEKASCDIAKLMERKSGVVDQLRNGVKQLVKARKIETFYGLASFQKDKSVLVKGKSEETISAKHTIIATGSTTVELPFLKFDGKTVVSSDQAIAFDKVPANLVVVGGGAIGLELGSVWARLGSKVTVVELLPKIATGFDDDIAKLSERIFKKQGLNFELGAKVTGVKTKSRKTYLTAEKDGKEIEILADKILVSVGRKPYTEGLGLDALSLALDERGRIPVDQNFQTKVAGVYAIGDVIAGPMLAHKAEEEGVAVVEKIAGHAGHVNYDVIPNVIYTEPEISGVGQTEAQLKEKGIAYKVGKFPLAANGRAIATDATDGIVKVIADKETDKILGIQILAKGSSEMIAAAVTHMEYGGSAEDIARTVHAHPTISESIKEAAMAVDKMSIHSM